MIPWNTAAWLSLDDVPAGAPPSYRLADDTGPLLLAADIEIYRPGDDAAILGEAWNVLAWNTLTIEPEGAADYVTLRVSDLGWVTRETDPAGAQPYAPVLSSGVEIDRAMDLAPDGVGAAAGWGGLRVVNDGGALDALIASGNVDGRPIRVRIGRKTRAAHGIWRDPAWGETADLIVGLGAGWTTDGQELRIALRDPSWWLDRRVEGDVYAGSGGLEGGSTLTGKRKPILRGGTAGDPVREIPAVLVDTTNGIYQVSDAEGAIVTLYERGLSGGITSGGTVADITLAAPSAGTYQVESSARGLFLRLGTFPPAGLITVDAWGKFPDGTVASEPGAVALEMLRQTLSVPPAWIDAASFTGLATARGDAAGLWIGPEEDPDGAQLLGLLMRSALARLVPRRTGLLAAVPLRAIPAGTVPVATYTTAEIVACVQRALPAPMTPPPYRVRVGWGRNHVTQTSDLAPTLSGARRQELADPWRIASASAAAVLAAQRRPSDPALAETALTSSAGGQALADDLAALWCIAAGRTLWDVTLPLSYALRHDVGDPILVSFPGPLAAGQLGRIVGEQIRTADNLATLQVLI